MSVVTNLILHMGILEDENDMAQKVNQYFKNKEWLGAPPVPIDSENRNGWYGGTKFLECNLFIGAYNHLDLDDFIKHLRALKWTSPEDLQIIVKEQNDDKFRIIDVFTKPEEEIAWE